MLKKPIHKKPRAKGSKQHKPKKPLLNANKKIPTKRKTNIEQSAITSLKQQFQIKPFYTGGRIVSSPAGLTVASLCHGNIVISVTEPSLTQQTTITIPDEEIYNFCYRGEKQLYSFTVANMLRYHNFNTHVIVKVLKCERNYPVDMQVDSKGRVLCLGCSNGWVKFYTSHLTPLSSHRSQTPIKKVQWDNQNRLVLYYLDEEGVKGFDLQLNAVIVHIKQPSLSTFQLMLDDAVMFVTNQNQLHCYHGNKRISAIDCQEIEQCVSMCVHDSCLLLSGPNKVLCIKKENQLCLPYPNIQKMLSLSTTLLLISHEQIFYQLNSSFKQTALHSAYNDEITDCRIAGVDGQWAIVTTNSSIIRLYHVGDGQRLGALLQGHSDIVLSVDCRGEFVASGGKDNCVRLWKVGEEGGEAVMELKGHSLDVTSVAISPCGRIVASASSDKTIKLWNLSSQSSISTTYAHQKSINRICYNSSGSQLLSSSHDKTIKLFNTQDMSISLTLKQKAPVWQAIFHSDSNILAVTATCGVLYTCKGQKLAVWGDGAYRVVSYSAGWITAGDGRLVGYNYKAVQVFEMVVQMGRIWGMDLKKGRVLAGIGGKVVLYSDRTEQAKIQKQAEREQQQMDAITFDAMMEEDRYREAALMAFSKGYTHSFIKAIQHLQHPSLYQPLHYNPTTQLIQHNPSQQYDSCMLQQQSQQLCKEMLKQDKKELIRLIKDIFQSSRFQSLSELMLYNVIRMIGMQQLVQLVGKQWAEDMLVMLGKRVVKLQQLIVETSFSMQEQ